MDSGGLAGAAATARRRAWAIGLVAVAAIAAGLFWILAPKPTAFTDDAYVQVGKTIVSPKVRGMVEAVVARENTPAKVGDLLVRIDPAEYDLKIAQAEGDLMAAKASAEAAHAGLARLDAEEKLSQGQVNAAQQAAGSKGASDPALREAFETARGQALVAARTRGDIQAALAQATAAQFRAET